MTSSALVLAGIALKWLVRFALPEESQFLEIVDFVLNTSVVSTAIVVTVCGFIVVGVDTVRSTREFIAGRRR